MPLKIRICFGHVHTLCALCIQWKVESLALLLVIHVPLLVRTNVCMSAGNILRMVLHWDCDQIRDEQFEYFLSSGRSVFSKDLVRDILTVYALVFYRSDIWFATDISPIDGSCVGIDPSLPGHMSLIGWLRAFRLQTPIGMAIHFVLELSIW